MATFDAKAFAAVQGRDNNLINSVGAAYGVPSCMLNIANDLLSLLPNDVLGEMRGDLNEGAQTADEHVKSVYSFMRNNFGILEWDTEAGTFKFISKSSKNGFDKSKSNWFTNSLGYLNGIATAGADLYDTAITIRDQVNDITGCISNYFNYKKFTDDNVSEGLKALSNDQLNDYNDEQYRLLKAIVGEAEDFITSCVAKIAAIDEVLLERQNNPQPLFSCSAIQFLSGTSYVEDCAAPPITQTEIFRLIYGPPRSSFGQFILSNDGIYFDSLTSGILPALTYLDNKRSNLNVADLWKFNQDPNLGGRGDDFTTENLKLYINTVLDPNIVNDSTILKPYYDKDGFLQDLIGNRNKRLYDLSSQLTELQESSAPQAVIFNHKQALLSESNVFKEQINKRKKQIQLAVELPMIYAGVTKFNPGEIPVNDFLYLAELNISLDLQKQRSLMFSQVDISGVVLPIQTSNPAAVSKLHSKNKSVDHLIITELGDGAIIYDGSSVSSTNGLVLQTENSLTTDSLIAIYNFLDTDVVEPSSSKFYVRNSNSKSDSDYAQLVADTQASVFKGGLGIPFLEGITKNNGNLVSGLGSYVRLPNISKLNDLFYARDGASIDFWVHVPDLTDLSGYNTNSTSSLFRLVLANENTGGDEVSSVYQESYSNKFGTDAVRGLVLGFTRDRRLTKGLPPSNSNSDNPITDSAFFLAPTQSLGSSSVGFINRSEFDGSSYCGADRSQHGMVVRLDTISESGDAVSSCQNEFCHFVITFNYSENTIKFYKDSELISTSSLTSVFGLTDIQSPSIPTFFKSNSFKYNSQYLNTTAPESLKNGPKLDTYFTPWIIGGGYTDGMYTNNNFMGGTYGGQTSGLKGFLESIKIYSKPLTGSEVLNNYEVHKNFFKNIDISSLN